MKWFRPIAAISLLWLCALTPTQKVVMFGNLPGWILKGASVDLDFANNRNYGCGGNFSTCLSVTRAQTVNSYATTVAGILVPFAANALRITDLGLLVEETRTNDALWARDLTNAAWVKVNMTTALNATGADGTANTATTLTATSGNATILQSITLGSTADTSSVYLKCITCTGNIQITENNGTAWTTCTSLVTNGFVRCSVTATLANPVIGLRIVNNGDSVVADFFQMEPGAFSTSPIPTTTVAVTRNADIPQLIGQAASTVLQAKAAFFQTNGGEGITTLAYMLADASNAFIGFNASTTVQIRNDALNTAQATIGSAGAYSGLVKTAAGFDSSSLTIKANGGTQVTSANAWGITAPFYLGTRAAGDRSLNGYMQRFALAITKGAFDGATK